MIFGLKYILVPEFTALCKMRMTGPEIVESLGMARSTVSAVPARTVSAGSATYSRLSRFTATRSSVPESSSTSTSRTGVIEKGAGPTSARSTA